MDRLISENEDCVSRANLISKLEILERRYGSDFYWETRKIVDKLPSVKPQPCGDAISRSDAISAIDEKAKRIKNEDTLNGLAGAVGILFDLPFVNPQERTGHWIEHPEIETSTPEYLMFYECSECGDKQCFCKSDIHKKHFCNNCGAMMVEPQEISYTVEQELNEYTSNIEIIEKKY